MPLPEYEVDEAAEAASLPGLLTALPDAALFAAPAAPSLPPPPPPHAVRSALITSATANRAHGRAGERARAFELIVIMMSLRNADRGPDRLKRNARAECPTDDGRKSGPSPRQARSAVQMESAAEPKTPSRLGFACNYGRKKRDFRVPSRQICVGCACRLLGAANVCLYRRKNGNMCRKGGRCRRRHASRKRMHGASSAIGSRLGRPPAEASMLIDDSPKWLERAGLQRRSPRSRRRRASATAMPAIRAAGRYRAG